MLQEGSDSTPMAMWNWAMEHGICEPNHQADDVTYLHLLPKAEATIRAGGIFYGGVAYVNPLDRFGKIAANARANGRQPIAIWYEPQADHIWIRDDRGSFLKCQLRGSETRYQDMRREEVADMLATTSAVATESKYAEMNSRVQLDEFIESKIATATADILAAGTSTSKAKKIADIRTNRALDKDAETLDVLYRQHGTARQKAVPNVPVPPYTPTSVEEYAGLRSAEVLSLLSRIAQVDGGEPNE
jgi:hypothetical protein